MVSNIKVLIVDDSILFREALARELRKDPRLVIVGTASDPFDARDKIIALKPDVMTLDVEMPKMNGIDFLRRLLPQYPLPVIVSSSLAAAVFDAIAAGAVDFVAKPGAEQGAMEAYAADMIAKIKIAADVDVASKFKPALRPQPQTRSQQTAGEALLRITRRPDANQLLAVGASTGGTEAIFNVLTKLPADIPGTVIVQHMPGGFTKLYAERLNKACAFEVREAEDNDTVRPGLALLAPGGTYQMRLVKGPRGYSVRLVDMEKVSGHKPSVDFLFDSVAEAAGRDAIGVILTGMGADGAKGLLKMRERGAYTIGQDQASCVVYGMPMVAFNAGAVVKQLPLDRIAQEICGRLSLRANRHA
ncbi:MAG: chemotaxis response regulator protein-glutamate methylesterase [Clostridiales Family XIII bacterium]|jgi:two-component system chemotaxis response regulator CheB|nr:chemotaxis response regulator protein-glutamate methylesterase [Clostridiales Family XIII bacterium]